MECGDRSGLRVPEPPAQLSARTGHSSRVLLPGRAQAVASLIVPLRALSLGETDLALDGQEIFVRRKSRARFAKALPAFLGSQP